MKRALAHPHPDPPPSRGRGRSQPAGFDIARPRGEEGTQLYQQGPTPSLSMGKGRGGGVRRLPWIPASAGKTRN
jgi:hypothetical protein